MKFGLDDKPSIGATLLYGVQWLMICLPVVLTSTFIAPEGEVVAFTQKLFAICGVAIIVQVLWGHKMPLVAGPAAVLLMGVLAASGHPASTIYPSMMIGGVLITLLALGGAMRYIHRVFTPRIVCSIVLLISFTMSKPILGLIFADEQHHLLSFITALLGIPLMAWANKVLRGVWKSMVVIVAMLLGSIFYYALTGFPSNFVEDSATPRLLLSDFSIDGGVALAFVFCYIALFINQIGSVESLGEMVGASDMPRRQRRGMIVTGAMNIVCGAMGVPGVVDYSLSPGVVASTSCASRFTMLPAALAMIVLALFPDAVAVLLTIPQPIMGIVLLYLMATQVAAGLHLMQSSSSASSFNDSLILAIPIMFTAILSFVPSDVMAVIPPIIRPIVGNSFVMGIIIVIALEHLVLKKR